MGGTGCESRSAAADQDSVVFCMICAGSKSIAFGKGRECGSNDYGLVGMLEGCEIQFERVGCVSVESMNALV